MLLCSNLVFDSGKHFQPIWKLPSRALGAMTFGKSIMLSAVVLSFAIKPIMLNVMSVGSYCNTQDYLTQHNGSRYSTWKATFILSNFQMGWKCSLGQTQGYYRLILVKPGNLTNGESSVMLTSLYKLLLISSFLYWNYYLPFLQNKLPSWGGHPPYLAFPYSEYSLFTHIMKTVHCDTYCTTLFITVIETCLQF
jgi:hypothetical protein